MGAKAIHNRTDAIRHKVDFIEKILLGEDYENIWNELDRLDSLTEELHTYVSKEYRKHTRGGK